MCWAIVLIPFLSLHSPFIVLIRSRSNANSFRSKESLSSFNPSLFGLHTAPLCSSRRSWPPKLRIVPEVKRGRKRNLATRSLTALGVIWTAPQQRGEGGSAERRILLQQVSGAELYVRITFFWQKSSRKPTRTLTLSSKT